jgi:hypothetical protein
LNTGRAGCTRENKGNDHEGEIFKLERNTRFPVGNEQAHWDENPVPGKILCAYIYVTFMCILHAESHVHCSEQIVGERSCIAYPSGSSLPRGLVTGCFKIPCFEGEGQMDSVKDRQG